MNLEGTCQKSRDQGFELVQMRLCNFLQFIFNMQFFKSHPGAE